MSCGCGGGRLPASVSLRMEAARLALAADAGRFDTLAPKVLAFITQGADLAALDAPPAPVAVGEGADAVTSRSALLNTPIQRVAGLDRKAVAVLVTSGARGIALGTLAQYTMDALVHDVGEDMALVLDADLRRYGLGLCMTTDSLRTWVLEGPK